MTEQNAQAGGELGAPRLSRTLSVSADIQRRLGRPPLTASQIRTLTALVASQGVSS